MQSGTGEKTRAWTVMLNQGSGKANIVSLICSRKNSEECQWHWLH